MTNWTCPETSAPCERMCLTACHIRSADLVALRAEVERLRGIVQGDLEEKAEAWGEVERMRAEGNAEIDRLRTLIENAIYDLENGHDITDNLRAALSPGAVPK